MYVPAPARVDLDYYLGTRTGSGSCGQISLDLPVATGTCTCSSYVATTCTLPVQIHVLFCTMLAVCFVVPVQIDGVIKIEIYMYR